MSEVEKLKSGQGLHTIFSNTRYDSDNASTAKAGPCTTGAVGPGIVGAAEPGIVGAEPGIIGAVESRMVCSVNEVGRGAWHGGMNDPISPQGMGMVASGEGSEDVYGGGWGEEASPIRRFKPMS